MRSWNEHEEDIAGSADKAVISVIREGDQIDLNDQGWTLPQTFSERNIDSTFDLFVRTADAVRLRVPASLTVKTLEVRGITSVCRPSQHS